MDQPAFDPLARTSIGRTTLRGAIEHAEQGHWSRAQAGFALRDIPALAASARAWRPPSPDDRSELMAPRWQGQPERLEVWYATVTDPDTGTGFWLHHELLAPASGAPRKQGWVVAFPPDAEPVVGRFAGDATADAGTGQLVFAANGATVRDGALEGRAGVLAWELAYSDAGPPLHTFPRALWERELLPGAQVVPAPSARFSGVITVDGRRHELEGAPGAVARIYGHGNAERWGWLHADLGDGDVIEVVAAVSRRRVLDRLSPLSFVQLREDGRDWPRNPLLAAPALRTELREDGFTTQGRLGSRRLRAEVGLPRQRSVTLRYDDPAGEGPRCTNSEIADLDLLVERRGRGSWRVDRHVELRGVAHAEVGRRP